MTRASDRELISLKQQKIADLARTAPHLNAFLDQRVRDGVIRRALGKWMHAGVMEEGVVSYPERGSPQGGVISPLVSNVDLHEVLDTWFECEVKPRLRGRALMVRYADDALLAFEREDDARRVLAVLPKRFERFGLTLHPEKTRLVDFRRPAWRGPNRSQSERRFDLLGFTHDWGRSQKGNWVVKRKTARSRFSRAARQIGQWCRHHRHLTVAEQQQALSQKLRGHDAYYGITGNARAGAVPPRGPASLEEVAQPPLAQGVLGLGGVYPPAAALPTPAPARGSQHLCHVASA